MWDCDASKKTLMPLMQLELTSVILLIADTFTMTTAQKQNKNGVCVFKLLVFSLIQNKNQNDT